MRVDLGGTEETFAQWVTGSSIQEFTAGATGCEGNTACVAAVANHAGQAIGFSDIGNAWDTNKNAIVAVRGASTIDTIADATVSSNEITIPVIKGTSGTAAPVALGAIVTQFPELVDGAKDTNKNLSAQVGAALKQPLTGKLPGNAGSQVLQRNQFYVTKGEPSSLEQKLIDYVTSPDQRAEINSVGFYSIYEYK